ncbi:AI-2E family transporter [Photobacterium sanctipauli]|uniref:AI-2E family transporter n=1 Tax=Photobacterium sanctipauli TaxID=1342794 RepID=A0A2T3NYS3_9GAMM|nr:AI-2E family transporter [Photobacterium sanctipauli]PSW21368.1 AI-2E family transporter [Photobacterium sanctipauli]
MNKQLESKQSSIFVSNMVESAIRIGLLFMLIVWTYDIVKPFIIPVLWGAIIAVALMPITMKLEGMLGGKRGLAATILALLGVAILIVPIVVVSGSLYDGGVALTAMLQEGSVTIPRPTQRIADIPLIGDKLFEVWNLFATNLEHAVARFLPEIKAGASTIAGWLGSSLATIIMFMISLLIAAGFMAHSDSMASAVRAVSIRVVGQHGEEWASLTAATVRSVLLGVVGVAFIQSVLIGAVMFVFAVPAAAGITLIVFIFAIAQLPALLVVLPVILYMYSAEDSTTATIFTVLVLVAALSENILKPMLMGRGVSIPMPVILIGAIGGMISAGIIGLFLGAVVLAIWYELFITWVKMSPQEEEAANEADETPAVQSDSD